MPLQLCKEILGKTLITPFWCTGMGRAYAGVAPATHRPDTGQAGAISRPVPTGRSLPRHREVRLLPILCCK